MNGLELRKLENGSLIFEPHEYVGKEPDTKFLYLTIRKIANEFGIHTNVASFLCSDEENGLERVKRSFYFSKVFASDIVGPMVLSQPTHVAKNPGHSSSIFIVCGHIGMYKNMEDGRLLYGKIESERDEVTRPTCGAIYHVMQRFLGKEAPENIQSWDVDLIGKIGEELYPFKEEFLKEYSSGKDDLEKLSIGLKYLVFKNVDVQVNRLLRLLTSSQHNRKKDEQLPKLVFGAVTINRYKYSDTTLLTQAFLIKDGKSSDLSKNKC
ncbi:MAG: hypothetical protein AABX33_03750 [Nanoarchaeota archaeon]